MSVKKTQLLGENFSTATHKLRKRILFAALAALDSDKCHRCGERITSIDELSIEHKESWQSAANPSEAFYDLNNIAFSHLHCNVAAPKATKSFGSPRRIHVPGGYEWCSVCKTSKPADDFTANANRWNGKQSECRDCRSEQRKQVA